MTNYLATPDYTDIATRTVLSLVAIAEDDIAQFRAEHRWRDISERRNKLQSDIHTAIAGVYSGMQRLVEQYQKMATDALALLPSLQVIIPDGAAIPDFEKPNE